MQTSSRDLSKAVLLLKVYSYHACEVDQSDSTWVICGGMLYKKYLADELVKEGHFTFDGKDYFPSVTYLQDNWINK